MKREKPSGASAQEEVGREEEVSPVRAVAECPFLCAQGVGWVAGEWRCLSFFHSIHCFRAWKDALVSLPPP